MSRGDTQLEAMIARIRSLPDLVREAAPDAADAVREDLERTIAAGTEPNGSAWKLREDGKKPLATAASSMFVAPIGNTVFVRLTGHVARHHLGRARGGIYRPVIPSSGIPVRMADAIKDVLTTHFRDHMRGA